MARLQYLDQMLARSLLMPERTLLQGTEGTKAEAGSHAEGAMPQREAEHRTITAAVNRQIVERLLEWNFGPEAVGQVWIEPAPLVDSVKSFMQQTFAALLADPIDGADVRRRIDLDAVMDALGIPANKEVEQPIGRDVTEADEQQRQAANRIAAIYRRSVA